MENEDLFESRKLGDMMCPELDNIKIGGYWDSSYVSYFKIELRRCLEGSINPFTKEDCKTMEETDKILNDRVYFSMIYQDALIDPDNYYNPLNSDSIYSTILINNGIMKREVLKYKEFLVDSDYGWILKTQEIQNLLGIDTITNDFLVIDKFNYNLYLESYFYIGKKVNKYRREYKKIQTLAAEVGGIIKFLINITSILVYFYSTAVYKYNLSNSLISGKEIHNLLNKKQTINTEIQLNKNPDYQNNSLKLLLNSNIKNEIKDENIQIEKQDIAFKKIFVKEEKVEASENIPFFDFFVNCFPFGLFKYIFSCCLNKKIQASGIIIKMKQFLNSQISIENLIKYNFKLEKLTHNILSSNQKKLVDYFEYGNFQNYYNIKKLEDKNQLFKFSREKDLDSVIRLYERENNVNQRNQLFENILNNNL